MSIWAGRLVFARRSCKLITTYAASIVIARRLWSVAASLARGALHVQGGLHGRDFRSGTTEGAAEAQPSEARLFAQALLGRSVPGPAAAAADAQAKHEHLKWLASISTKHERELRRLSSAEAEARAKREQLEWLAAISTKHEQQFRRLLAAEAGAREAQERHRRFAETANLEEAEWDPAKHPRGGFPQNPGWFSPSGWSVGSAGKEAKETEPGGVAVEPTHSPATKPQLPAGHRGTWISGTRGNGVFRYNDSLENQQAGVAGKQVRFENQHIAVGGLPAEAYYGGNAGVAKVEIDTVTGTRADNRTADAEMRKKLKDPTWRRPKGYVWNHAGPPGSKTMELVKEGVHEAVAHKGPAAEPRALRRAAGARGASGKAMGALTVYLAARDALRGAGILQPDYEVTQRETYHYVSEDGSVFVVWPAGLFSSDKREFVAGPRRGQTEKITNEQVEQYRKQAEEEWGKYIRGTLFSEPRFIPGKKRTSLPLIEYRSGVSFEVGWIDQDGVHRYPVPKAAII